MERVDYIEDRVNKESKFRRDGFKTLINEIGSLKAMLQQALENKVEGKDTETVQDTKTTHTELEEKVLLLTNAFIKEKILNKRFRRKFQNYKDKLEEQLVSGKVFAKAEKDSTTSENYEGECNCSISSCPVNSTPSPNESMTSDKSCLELYDNGFKSNGIYKIEIEHKRKVSIYCDMTTDGGGWTVFQRRQDGSVNFSRYWNEYETGFGNLTGEFWLGNKYLNLLTDNYEQHQLRIELEDHDGNRAYAKYSSFKVGSKRINYTLEVSGYTGSAGDSLANSNLYGPHDQMEFTTRDADNDKYEGGNCASDWDGGWWFNNCFDSNLNGLYQGQSKCETEWKCIVWNTWKGAHRSMKFTEMKFR
ncbi:fibrinogen-like protein 1 [Mercenaria mercenaria]|uniref:fibrinogen-like protein 1 n=1 Tax=Mercenaria mercenaria TaxID=6596 RepID=UPI00234F56C3|nr:fibrinogen-like protein 1 [Mercenaria mercenaria]